MTLKSLEGLIKISSGRVVTREGHTN